MGMYVASGEAMADLLASAIGPVEAEEVEYDFDAVTIPDFLAGFMFQITGDNKMTEIEACYQGGDEIVVDAEAAPNDIKGGQYIAGVKAIGKIVGEVPDALSTCEGMQDDIAKLEAYAA